MKIKSFEIENFRSLKKFKVDAFDSTTIFYGLNNAGKSNVLNALHYIFKRKPKVSSNSTVPSFTEDENFHSGVLSNFSNNYFNNTSSEINFVIEIEIDAKKLSIDPAIVSVIPKNSVVFKFVGAIFKVEPVEYNLSEIKMTEVSVSGKKIYEGKDGFYYFPTLDKTKKNQPLLNQAFTKLVDVFNNCVHIIPSERDMHEIVLNSEKATHITSRSFKKFLYDLYLSPAKHHLFEAIDDSFSKEPFGFGKLSFSEDKDLLEIMVNERGFRLPIKHLGSGVMQSLYIVASIVCSKSRIICIEELEQNLSPTMQYQMLKKIQQMISESQFDQLILSSHSSVYSKPALGNIYFLEKTNGQTTINKKEVKKLSKKLKEHLAETQFVYDEKEFKQLQEFLRTEHDFK